MDGTEDAIIAQDAMLKKLRINSSEHLDSTSSALVSGLPHPGLARAWAGSNVPVSDWHSSPAVAHPPPLHGGPSTAAPGGQCYGVHSHHPLPGPHYPPAHSELPQQQIGCYQSMNAMLSQLHAERVSAGARRGWYDADEVEEDL